MHLSNGFSGGIHSTLDNEHLMFWPTPCRAKVFHKAEISGDSGTPEPGRQLSLGCTIRSYLDTLHKQGIDLIKRESGPAHG